MGPQTLAPAGLDQTEEDIKTKIKNYQISPFDSRFPSENCWQNYLDLHRCEKAMTAKGGEDSVCVQVPLPHFLPGGLSGKRHVSWEDLSWLPLTSSVLHLSPHGGEGGPGYMVIPTLGSRIMA
uniref:Uncharacterized protein n=1 Tax=Sus scrofa TaxID=9823 RepID=A0A8D1L4M8_PIG